MNRKYEFKTSKAKVTFRERDWDARNSKPRIYVDSDRPFNVIEDLANRTRRPHQVWKSSVMDALAELQSGGRASFRGENFKFSWSQKAGCSCGCSPAFILSSIYAVSLTPPNEMKQFLSRFDIWVELSGAPTVDESLEPRFDFVEPSQDDLLVEAGVF
jgi:hypothetical protein